MEWWEGKVQGDPWDSGCSNEGDKVPQLKWGRGKRHRFSLTKGQGYPKCRAPTSSVPMGSRPLVPLLESAPFRRGQAQGSGGGAGHPDICPTSPHAQRAGRRAMTRPPAPAHLHRLAQLQVEGDHAHALQPGREARPGRCRSPRPGGPHPEAVARRAGPGARQRVHHGDCSGQPRVAGGTAGRRCRGNGQGAATSAHRRTTRRSSRAAVAD